MKLSGRAGLRATAIGVISGLLFGATAAQAEDGRLYELRTYYAAPGKFEALQSRFRDHTIRLFARHGITNVAYWTRVDDSSDGALIYVLSYPDMQAREASWAAFRADPEWKAAHAASEVNGKLTVKQESVFMKAADYSPAIAVSGAVQ